MVASFDTSLFSNVGVAPTGEGFGNAADFLRSISSETSLSNNWSWSS